MQKVQDQATVVFFKPRKKVTDIILQYGSTLPRECKIEFLRQLRIRISDMDEKELNSFHYCAGCIYWPTLYEFKEQIYNLIYERQIQLKRETQKIPEKGFFSKILSTWRETSLTPSKHSQPLETLDDIEESQMLKETLDLDCLSSATSDSG